MYNTYIDGIVGIGGQVWEVLNMCAAKRLSESERKKEIMDSAFKVIVSKGLEKTTMEEIISGTTLSKGGVYHYYKSVNDIFKDIMISGIDYRNSIIKEHLIECENNCMDKIMSSQLVDKIIDDNPYMPLYVEFLIAKKRNPEFKIMMEELQEQTKERFKNIIRDTPGWIFNPEIFQFTTDFINGMILAADVLEARENFKKNRHILEKMFIYIFKQGSEDSDESL